MTNYNDGSWYGWNGGECPVHPETVVECICLEGVNTSYSDGDAGEWNWDDEICPIIAFRVIKEHKEPREFWIVDGCIVYDNYDDCMMNTDHNDEIIHVREVLP